MASAYFNLGNVYLDKRDKTPHTEYYQQAKFYFDKAIEVGSDETVCGKKHPLVARHADAFLMFYFEGFELC